MALPPISTRLRKERYLLKLTIFCRPLVTDWTFVVVTRLDL